MAMPRRLLLAPKRRVLKGRGTEEVINQYNPALPVVGRKPYGHPSEAVVEQRRLALRQKLPNDELNPVHPANWRRYELAPKENRHNPDSFHFEQFKFGGKAYQQVYPEDMERLMEYPEKGALVVDVRSDFSLVKQHIPYSIRIPVEEVTYALQLDRNQFIAMYGFEPPEKGVEIICVSHDGIASEKALQEFERWGHTADCLFNFRYGTNHLFNEDLSDWGNQTQEVDAADFAKMSYPVQRPDYLSTVGPLSDRYYPYPAEQYEEQVRRDEEGTWTVPAVDKVTHSLGKHIRKRHSYQQLVDGQWLRARFGPSITWYDNSHREPFFRWREPDLSHDRAFRPTGIRYNQFWRTVPH